MKAVRVDRRRHYSPTSPAPSSALELRSDISQPVITNLGDILVAVKASTVTRGSLAWPELYAQPNSEMGNDFAGVVIAVHSGEAKFREGDAVYGMTGAHKGSAWAEYIVATTEEAYLKPDCLTWEEAAAIPMSALTADQALFDHAGLEVSSHIAKRVLVTGAAGAVGMFVVRFAASAGYHVIACSSSIIRNSTLLSELGAKEVCEYGELPRIPVVDVIIDTVGGEVLESCWQLVKAGGVLISVETSSWNFVEEHDKSRLSVGQEDHIAAKFFIVEPSKKSMARISEAVEANGLRGRIAKAFPLSEAKAAYDLAESGRAGSGKIILTI